MGEPRIASLEDDPTGSFEDRLLLALGIWPHHAAQVGHDSVLDAVMGGALVPEDQVSVTAWHRRPSRGRRRRT